MQKGIISVIKSKIKNRNHPVTYVKLPYQKKEFNQFEILGFIQKIQIFIMGNYYKIKQDAVHLIFL